MDIDVVNGRIETYKLQDDYWILKQLDNNKPSKRIIKSKKGLKAIEALHDLEMNHNVSWYKYLKERNINNMDDVALFYRGNKITFREMFEKSDEVAKSMVKSGLKEGEEIGVCVSNTPEFVYIILAANRLGLKVNRFGEDYDPAYISEIVSNLSNKVLFVSDDNYEKIKPAIMEHNFNNVVVTSLADSLPENVEQCDEYEPELDRYYHFDNKAKNIVAENNVNSSSYNTFNQFVDIGKDYTEEIPSVGNLETDFLITYTSGSTKIGHPKAMIHKNRSLITMGRFHDPELCGNPKIPGLRGLAHIHSDSNTDIITCISDNLMQGWSVALEPLYSEKLALDYVLLNKPNYLNATTSFMLEMAKQYLIDKRYHKDGVGRKLPFLLAAFAVGEETKIGEEKFINKFLRESRAGSGVSIKGLKLPFTTLSIGGGDCEHGGIYYTLWKSLYQKLYSPIMGKQQIGMFPVPYANVTALKMGNDGVCEECSYGEYGIIVANSYSNFSGYKNNPEETKKLLVKDNVGRTWVSCNVFGYVDKIGGVHVKGRIPDKNMVVQPFVIDDVVTMDSKNVLSCSTVEVDGYYVMSIQFQPNTQNNFKKIFKSMYSRLQKSFSPMVMERLSFRIIPTRDSYPLTNSGKRSLRKLEQMKFENTYNLTDFITSNMELENDYDIESIQKK